jgi:hypothetical protein
MTEALFNELGHTLTNPSGWMRRLTIVSSNARYQKRLANDIATFAGDLTGKDVHELDVFAIGEFNEPQVLVTKFHSLKDIRRIKSLLGFGHHVIATVDKNTIGDVLDALAFEFSQDGKKDLSNPINMLVDLYELPGKYSVVTHLVITNDLQKRLLSNEPVDWSLEALRECHFCMISEKSRYHHLNISTDDFQVPDDEIHFWGPLEGDATTGLNTAKGIT